MLLLKPQSTSKITSCQHPPQTDFDGPVFANYLFGLYLTISKTKQDQAPSVMSMGKFGAAALNFGPAVF